MPRKIDLKAEKRAKNEEYALKYRKRVSPDELEAARQLRLAGGRAANWCRTRGHPLGCNCIYL